MSVKIRIIILLVIVAILIVGFVVNRFKQKTDTSSNVEIDTSMFETKSIDEIWGMKDRNQFVISMYLYIAEKCEYGSAMQNLNDEQRVFYITQNLESEVNNGGFSQFYCNTDGLFVNELVSTFERINAYKTAEICKKAVSIFGDTFPVDMPQIQEILNTDDEEMEEENSQLLSECDMEFYEYEEDLEELNYQFIINNKESFSK